MSAIEGSFKAKVFKVETTTDELKPFVKVSFLLTDEYIRESQDYPGVWEPLTNPQGVFASKVYSLSKVVKPGKTMSGYEHTKNRWLKDYGFEWGQFKSLDALSSKMVGMERILVLESDDSQYHTIKWINNIGGKIKEGMIDLQKLL